MVIRYVKITHCLFGNENLIGFTFANQRTVELTIGKIYNFFRYIIIITKRCRKPRGGGGTPFRFIEAVYRSLNELFKFGDVRKYKPFFQATVRYILETS